MPTLADRSVTPAKYSHAPHAMALSLADLMSSDGHRVNVALNVTVRLLERSADVAVFNEQFSGGQQTSLDDVRQFLATTLRPVAESLIADRSAADCLDHADTLQAPLVEKLNAVGFGCGLEFLPPISVQASSDSLAAERISAATAKRQSAALERAAMLRERIDQGAAAHLPASEIAELLPALLQAEKSVNADFFLAAGPNFIDVGVSPLDVVSVPGCAPIGPLRSVRTFVIDGRPMLALGGQRGIAITESSGQSPPQIFTMDRVSSQRGFNAVVFYPALRQLIATHGELGIVRWQLPADAQYLIAPPLVTPLLGARLLLHLDDRLLLASDGNVLVTGAAEPRIVHADTVPVIALLDLDESIAVVRGSGEVARLDRTTLQPLANFGHPSPVRCAALLRAAGVRLLLLGTEAGVIDVVTFAGQPVGHLRPRAGVSLLATAGSTVAALSADRATLELFDGLTSASTINLVARFGHRATDLVRG